MQEPFERLEARELLVVLLDLDLRLAELFGIVAIEPDGADEPQHRVPAEEGEGEDQERGHDQEYVIQQRVVLPIHGVGVWRVLGEAGVGLGMALLAGGDDVGWREARIRVIHPQHVVVPVAVVAGGHIAGHVRLAQGHGLAVVGVPIVFEAILVALPADLVAEGLEVPAFGCLDLVRRMALDANGAPWIAFGEQLAMHAFVVDLFDRDVAFATGLGHVGVVDGRAAVHDALDVVNAVAVVAAGRHDEALLEQCQAMDAFLVLGLHLWVLHLVFRGDVLVRVAFRAHHGQVHLVHG